MGLVWSRSKRLTAATCWRPIYVGSKLDTMWIPSCWFWEKDWLLIWSATYLLWMWSFAHLYQFVLFSVNIWLNLWLDLPCFEPWVFSWWGPHDEWLRRCQGMLLWHSKRFVALTYRVVYVRMIQAAYNVNPYHVDAEKRIVPCQVGHLSTLNMILDSSLSIAHFSLHVCLTLWSDLPGFVPWPFHGEACMISGLDVAKACYFWHVWAVSSFDMGLLEDLLVAQLKE